MHPITDGSLLFLHDLVANSAPVGTAALSPTCLTTNQKLSQLLDVLVIAKDAHNFEELALLVRAAATLQAPAFYTDGQWMLESSAAVGPARQHSMKLYGTLSHWPGPITTSAFHTIMRHRCRCRCH